MKRKFCSVILALLAVICLLTPVSAAGFGRIYVPMTCYRFGTVVGGYTVAAEKTSEKAETTIRPVIGSDYEQKVVTLVNRERAANGLAALSMSKTLSDGARIKSQDLHDNRYFSHNSPTYGTPFEMMRSFGITYSYAGENIAMGYSTPEAVVRAWMQSPGHRANILSAHFTSIGVGYVADGGYWTQWFHG